jgi:hypothetical protein
MKKIYRLAAIGAALATLGVAGYAYANTLVWGTPAPYYTNGNSSNPIEVTFQGCGATRGDTVKTYVTTGFMGMNCETAGTLIDTETIGFSQGSCDQFGNTVSLGCPASGTSYYICAHDVTAGQWTTINGLGSTNCP